MQAMVSKMGPWGGNGGDTCDIKVIPHHLESVIICSGTIIDALAFSYWDRNGHRHTTQFWGGILGDVQTVSKQMMQGRHDAWYLFHSWLNSNNSKQVFKISGRVIFVAISFLCKKQFLESKG